MPTIRKPFAVLLAFMFVLSGVSICQGRTTRSCTAEIYFLVEQVEIDGVYTDLRRSLRLNAGHLVFRRSAPAGQPNRARMRASKTAEECINNWYHGPNCSKAHSTSYGDDFGRLGIRTLMTRSICADLTNQGRGDLRGRILRGKLYGKIDGDRCCKDSARGCPYDYGVSRAGRLNTRGLGGRVLWDLHYEQCPR